MSILLEKYEKALAYEILINREYRILDDIISDLKVILDIGGHFGFFSAYVLLIKAGFYNNSIVENVNIIDEIINNLEVKGDYNIHFFEPVSFYFIQAKNLLSKFEDNIIFNNCGILDKTGVFDVYKPKISSQTSLYKSFMNNGEEVVKCSFIKLEEYLIERNLEQIDLLKMDIEGAEFDVLLDLNEKVFDKLKVLFLEYHLLDNESESKYCELLIKLKKHYIYVNTIESKHNPRLGYLYCKN